MLSSAPSFVTPSLAYNLSSFIGGLYNFFAKDTQSIPAKKVSVLICSIVGRFLGSRCSMRVRMFFELLLM